MSAPATSPLPEPLEALNAELARRDAVQSAHSRFYLKPSRATAEALTGAIAAWSVLSTDTPLVEYAVASDIVDADTREVVETDLDLYLPTTDLERAQRYLTNTLEDAPTRMAVVRRPGGRTVFYGQNARLIARPVAPWSVVEQEKN